MNLNWFLSRTVRHATHMRKHVWKILNAQRDLLSAPAIEAVNVALQEMQSVCRGPLDKQAVLRQMTDLETVANKWLKAYPNAAMRENIEVLLVAIAVAMGIRTFIAQPFKIPTGSMQPTLYGVTDSRGGEIPGRLQRVFLYWFSGVTYDHIVAETEGSFVPTPDVPSRFLLFNLKQSFVVGSTTYTVWFPPDKFLHRAGLWDRYDRPSSKVFKKGEDIVRLKCYSGDHLFVDRFTYNFRRPTRGEIVVFETKNIQGMQAREQGQFYIKRLVALGGEKVRIGDDRHLYINGAQLTAATPHFENVYSFDPNEPPTESKYSGHVNGRSAPFPSPYFRDAETETTVPPKHYMVMGDNTMNSWDSRGWGPFPQENVIGKSFLVYWPFGAQDGRKSRFGFSTR